MSFVCMTYIGTGANLKHGDRYTERPTHALPTMLKLTKPTPKPYKPNIKKPKS